MNYKIVPLLFICLLAACTDLSHLRSDQSIKPVKEYERMLVGRLDSDYIGTEQCLAKCHKHDKIFKDYKQSVHGLQIESQSGLPLVNCETCHGPGSLAVDHIENETCDFKTFIQIEQLPAQAQSLLCLKCHSAASTPILQFWSAGAHASSDVSCSDCHELHQGPQQKVTHEGMNELCFNCHQNIQMEFAQFSHHPVPEGKIACTDCHNPHGTAQDKMLTGLTEKETCSRCHMDKQGPFVFEHADVMEDCTNCHRAHGAANNSLLTAAQPFLCMQCHTGHYSGFMAPSLQHSGGGDPAAFKKAFYNRCTDCHSAIHGTDVPDFEGRGTFIAR
jgi:DmsE family decaheme c-type cytochrome